MEAGDNDYFKLNISEQGCISISFSHAYIDRSWTYWELYLYNENKSLVLEKSYDGNIGYTETTGKTGLPSGIYYLKIKCSSYTEIPYNIKINYAANSNYEREFNNSFSASNSIKNNTKIYGNIMNYDDVDYYKFTIPQRDKIKFRFGHTILDSDDSYWNMKMYNSKYEKIINPIKYYGDEKETYYTLDLSAGTYYLEISIGGDHSDANYYFTISTTTGLSTPVISSVTNKTNGVSVVWGKVNGAVKYRVYRKTGNGSWTKIGDTKETSFTDISVKSSMTYSYTVRCITSDGKSYTSDYNKTGKSIKYISSPIISKIANGTSGITVQWGKITGAAKYRVLRKTGSGSWTKVGDTTGNSFTDKTVKSGVAYTYTIRCIGNDGKNYTSDYDKTGKKITFISSPVISKVKSVSSGITIQWGKVTGAAKYRVLRKTSSGSWTKIGDITGTSFTDKTAKKGTTYFYSVRCINKAGTAYTSGYDSVGKKIKR